MPARTSGWIKRLGILAVAVVSLAAVSAYPASAQSRTLATLADVPALVPAPYHPHSVTAVYSSALYDLYPYYGRVYQGGAPHYWH